MSRKLIIPSGLIENPNQENVILIPGRIRRSRGNLIARRQGGELVAHQLPEFDDELSSPSPSHGYSAGDDSFQRDFQALDGSQLPCSSLRSSPCSTQYSMSPSPAGRRPMQPRNLFNASAGSSQSAESAFYESGVMAFDTSGEGSSGYCSADTSGFDVARRLGPNLNDVSMHLSTPEHLQHRLFEDSDNSFLYDELSFDVSAENISQERYEQGLRQLRGTFNMSGSPANVSRPCVQNQTFDVSTSRNRTMNLSRPTVAGPQAANQTYAMSRGRSPGSPQGSFELRGQARSRSPSPERGLQPRNLFAASPDRSGGAEPCPATCGDASRSGGDGSEYLSYINADEDSYNYGFQPWMSSTHDSAAFQSADTFESEEDPDHVFVDESFRRSQEHRFNVIQNATPPSADPNRTGVVASPKFVQGGAADSCGPACSAGGATFAMPRSRTPSPARRSRTPPRMASRGSPRRSPTGGDVNTTYGLPSDRKSSPAGGAYQIAAGSTPSGRSAPTSFLGDACSPICSTPNDLPQSRARTAPSVPRGHAASNATFYKPLNQTRIIPKSPGGGRQGSRSRSGAAPVGEGGCDTGCSAGNTTYAMPQNRASNATFNKPLNQTRIIPKSPGFAGNTTYQLPGSPQALNRTRTLASAGGGSAVNRTCPSSRNQTMNLSRPTVNMNQTRTVGRSANTTYGVNQCSDGCSQ